MSQEYGVSVLGAEEVARLDALKSTLGPAVTVLEGKLQSGAATDDEAALILSLVDGLYTGEVPTIDETDVATLQAAVDDAITPPGG